MQGTEENEKSLRKIRMAYDRIGTKTHKTKKKTPKKKKPQRKDKKVKRRPIKTVEDLKKYGN